MYIPSQVFYVIDGYVAWEKAFAFDPINKYESCADRITLSSAFVRHILRTGRSSEVQTGAGKSYEPQNEHVRSRNLVLVEINLEKLRFPNEITLATHLANKLRKQLYGEKGLLRTDGGNNFFYLSGCRVKARYENNAKGWYLDAGASSLDISPGDRLFSYK